MLPGHVVVSAVGDLAALRDQARRFDDLGVAGVLVPDHLFVTIDGDRARAFPGVDPFVVLAAIATLSDRLIVGTIVANVGIVHPAVVLRHALQLAALAGGERVLAGLGAGWNTEEFDALGMTMPGHRDRLDRLEESCALARALFDDGVASLDGAHVVARSLPATPATSTAPRLLVGGGSDRLLDIAGRYADVVDLNGSSRRTRLGRDRPVIDDHKRRRSTTVDDLVDSTTRVRTAASGAGRPAPALSVLIDTVDFDAAPGNECPYVLTGPPAAMRDALDERVERIGLDRVLVSDGPHLDRLFQEVLSA